MVFKFFTIRLLSSSKEDSGTSLVEVIIIILMIGIFSSVLVSNFPKILREFALSRATYKLAQDIRKTQDLGLSGVEIINNRGDSIKAKGYGVYADISSGPAEQYLIYADRGEYYNKKYDDDSAIQFCNETEGTVADCVLEIIELDKSNPDLYIKSIENSTSDRTSINFNPPNPTVTIDFLAQNNFEIGIVLGLKSDETAQRTVWVNTSGLIRAE